MKRITLLMLGCLALMAVGAKKPWLNLNYQSWSKEDAVEVLTHSPWATMHAFLRPFPGNSALSNDANADPRNPRVPPEWRGQRDLERRYIIRFLSARPIRMAFARMAVLLGRANNEQAAEFVQTLPYEGRIVVAIDSPREQDRFELEHAVVKNLLTETYLFLAKSKTRIQAERYLRPSESGRGEAIFLFPRPPVSLADDKIHFVCRLKATTDDPQMKSPIDLSREFKLKDMVFDGKLEL